MANMANSPETGGGRVFLFHIMFGVVAVLLRLPRRLLLGLLLFILGLLLLELVHPTPRNLPHRGAGTGLRATPPPVAHVAR